MTADVRRSPRRGTSSACAIKRMHRTQAREIVACAPGDASFTRSYGPCTSILTMLRRRKSRRWGVRLDITVGQARATERNQHWGRDGRTMRGSPRAAAPARERARYVEKRKEAEAFVPARIEESGFGCPHVVKQLQKSVGDVWSRISSANALQKQRPGSSERGPSSERGSAGETVGRCIGRNDGRESASPVQTRARTGARPRVARDRHPAVLTSPRAVRGSRDRGNKATGSYEGSLPMEGIPDHHAASAFTRRRQRWSWRLSASPDPHETFQKEDVRPSEQRARKRREAWG
jgi:hypothetical protein